MRYVAEQPFGRTNLDTMESATKVGKIFSKAGEQFHNLANMTVLLDPTAAEIHAIEEREKVSYTRLCILLLLLSKHRFQAKKNSGQSGPATTSTGNANTTSMTVAATQQ